MESNTIHFVVNYPYARKAERYRKRVERKRAKARYTKKAVSLLVLVSLFLLVFGEVYSPPERGARVAKSVYARFESGWVYPSKPIIQNLVMEQSATFTATAYCLCEKCCGEWARKRGPGPAVGAAGTPLVPGVSVAIDRNFFEFGTKFLDESGNIYVAQDTGSGVNGYWVDIFMGSHQEAKQFGMQDIVLSWEGN